MKKLFKRSERGLAMPELLVAITVILVVLTASAFVLVNSLRNQTENEARDRAVQVVRDEIERARALSFDELALNPANLKAVSGNHVYDHTTVANAGEKELVQNVYATNPIVNAVTENGAIEPWGRPEINLAERGDEGGEGEELTEYFIRRDVTYYPDAPENPADDGYTSREVTITTYWKKGDKIDSASMSWVRTPSVSERSPDDAVVGEDITLKAPTNVSYTYDALGKNMDVFWYFSQTGVSENDLQFEIYLGTPTNMKKVRTAPGAARMMGSIPVDGATHLFVRASYRGVTADSSTITLSAPTIVTAPEAPVISGAQVPGTTTARFSFTPVSQATVYTARYRINEQNWITIGDMTPNSNWTSPEMDAGGKIEFSVFAANVAGSSPVQVSTVNMVGKPGSPVIDPPKQRMANALFTFSAGEGADSYRAQYRINDENWINLTNPRARQEIAINGQGDGNVVHFRVASFSNISGLGEYANASYQILPPPSEPEIYLSEQRPGQAVFGFAVAPNADSYEASWRVAGGSWQSLRDVVPGEEITLDWKASTDQTYEFRVRAHSEASGSSGYSQTTLQLLTPPAAPMVTSATQSGQEARFIFGSVARAQGYLAEYRIGEEGDWINIPDATPDTTMRVKSSGAHGEVVEFRVQAFNSTTGNSDYGVRSLTMVGKPETPEFTRAEQVDRDAVFVFAASARADSYRVQYQIGANGSWQNYSNPRPGAVISIRGTGAQQERVSLRVWASNIAGETDSFGEATVTLVVPPEAPKIIQNVQNRMNAIFTFEESIGADTYVAQYRLAGGAWVDIDLNDYLPEAPEPGTADNPGAANPREPITVTLPALAGIRVDFRVKAMNSAGESDFSNSSVTMIPPPGAPTITKSVQSGPQAVFTFAPVSGAASYEASYRIANGSWVTANVGPGAEFKVNANVGQKVDFRVRALNVAGESNFTQSSVTMIAPPATPVINKSIQEGNKAVFAFNSVPTASSYVAQYKLNDGAWTNASATPGSDFSVTAGGGQTVEFRVKAVNVAGESAYATTKVDLVHPPASPTITKNVQVLGQAVFAYSSVVGADSYVAEYRVASGNWTTANVAPGADFKVNANAGQKVDFRVKARNAAGDSAYVDSSVTMIAPPAAPVIRTNNQSGMNARFVFNAVSGASSYEAEYQINSGAWTSVSASPSTTISIPAAAGQTVNFRVKAINVAGESAWATSDVTLIPAPAVPSITNSEQIGMEAIFEFGSVATATNYSGRYRIDAGTWQTLTGLSPSSPVKVTAAGGQKVEFQVRAGNAAGNSAYSAVSSVDMVGIPAVPTITQSRQSINNAIFLYGSVASASSYEASYRIGTGAWVSVSNGPGSNVTVAASAGQTVEFRVRSVNAAGASSYATASVTMISKPDAPVVTGTQVGTQARFSFAAADGATSYYVDYRIGSGSWVEATVAPGANFSVNANAPVTVYFRVRADNVAGSTTGQASVNLVPVPGVPQFTSVNKNGSNAIVNFTAPAYATSYQLHVQRDGGTWVTVSGAAPNTNISVPANGADILAFRVRAYSIAGWSAYAETSIVMLDAPAAPRWTTSEQSNATTARFTFGSVATATTYETQYRINSGNWVALTTAAPNTQFSVNGSAGNVIEVRSRAMNIGGASDWSHSTVTMVGVPAVPTWTRSVKSGTDLSAAYSTSTNADSYTVQVKRDSGTWQTVSGTSPNTTFTVPANGAAQVFLRVRANNVAGSSAYRTTDVIFVSVPSAPVISNSQQETATGAVFSYSPVSEADSYEVQYRINSGSWFTANLAPNTIMNVPASAGNRIDFQVRATNIAGTSPWATASVTMATVPAPPNVTGVANSTTRATFTWPAVSGANSAYEVQRRCGVTSGWGNLFTNSTRSSVVDCEVAGVAELRVRSVNIAGTSAWATASVQLPAPAPAAPTVSGESTSVTRASFTWDSVEWADRYNVQTRCDSEAWGSTISTTSRSRAVTCDSGATARIRVQAVNASGVSAWTSASVALPAPDAPTLSIGSLGQTSVRFDWTAVTGATNGYEWRTQRNGGTWSAWTSRSTLNITLNSGYTQGDKVGFQVRAKNARGVGPTSNTVTADLQIVATDANGWMVNSNGAKTVLGFELINKYENPICPSPLGMRVRFRDKVTERTYWSNDWSAWNGKTGGTLWRGIIYNSGIGSIDTNITQNQQIVCWNTSSGNTGPVRDASFNMSARHTPWRHT